MLPFPYIWVTVIESCLTYTCNIIRSTSVKYSFLFVCVDMRVSALKRIAGKDKNDSNVFQTQ